MLIEIIFLLEFIRIVELVDLSLIASPGFKEKNKHPFSNVYGWVNCWTGVNWKEKQKTLFSRKKDLSCQSDPPLQ